MKKLLDFTLKAISQKTVYVDVDGTILKTFKAPDTVPGKERLAYWTNHLDVTPRIWERLVYCAFLKLFGVKLIIWTNRHDHHKEVTFKALGISKYLFSEYFFWAGKKSYSAGMLAIDDDLKFKGLNTLTVEKL